MSDNSRVRVSIVGVVIVALFASLFARLWFLQMGPEQKLGRVVSSLTTRVIQTESPRGEILDRNGKVLAQDVAAWAVTVDRNLKAATRDRVLGQLAEVLGVKETVLRANYDSVRQSPLQPAVVWLNVPLSQQLAIREHSEDYPGVNVVELTVRRYRYDMYASQLLGYLGEVDASTPKEFKQLEAKGYRAGDLIGRDGVEAAFESVLRGKPRRETVQVDPTGKQVGPPLTIDPGTVGKSVKLTIDINAQVAAEKALAEGVAAAKTMQDTSDSAKAKGYSTLKATGGAVVVLDPHDGSVVAMASYPTYPLSWWVGGISTAHFAWLSNPATENPLLNRATLGQYAPGSTFKLVPSIAMTRYGVRGAGELYDDQGTVILERSPFSNDNNAKNGWVDLSKALTVSSDVYFDTAADKFWGIWTLGDKSRGLGIQAVAHELGFGTKTGIELAEAPGRVPDPTWKSDFANANYKKGSQELHYASIWYPADNIHAAIGQGDDFVTPLQLVDAYATFANGGTLWTPHVEGSVIDPMTHKAISTYVPKSRGTVAVDAYTRSQMLAGFTGVVANPAGTAYPAFRGSFIPGGVAGKTGTADVQKKGSTSLFAAFTPIVDPKYAIVAVVEEGGHGAQIAAPIVRQVIEVLNKQPPTRIPTGNATAGKD